MARAPRRRAHNVSYPHPPPPARLERRSRRRPGEPPASARPIVGSLLIIPDIRCQASRPVASREKGGAMDTMRSVGGFEGAAGAAEGARQSKVDRVYAALKQAIVSGELAPLTLIDKTAWSGRFEVSRLSITSAVNRLAFEGVVVIEPQRGSYVSRIRLADVKQWMRCAACSKSRSRRRARPECRRAPSIK